MKSDGKSGKTDEHALIAEYRRLKPVYADLCLSMSNLLYSLLQNGGYKFHLTHRVKDVEELRSKIRRRRDRYYRVLGDVEDLAGVRVIFYLESEKEGFIRELRRELSGEIRREDHCKEEGYRATHLTVSFGEKRYRLSEYRKFRGLKCEIQMTSILCHAWSEIEHDIFYKEDRDKPSGRGKKLSELRERMSVLMNDHITRANAELEDIARQVRNIRGEKEENHR